MRFSKSGEWISVTVDDVLPCSEDGLPLFASASTPGVLWPCIFEKAYAKLHTSYAALNGGSEADAFADLTGGIPSVLDLNHPQVAESIASGALWAQLFAHCSTPGALIGASHFDAETASNNAAAPGLEQICARVTLDPELPAVPLRFSISESADAVAVTFCEENGLAVESAGAIAAFVRQHQSAAAAHAEERRKAPAAVRRAAAEADRKSVV